MKIPESKRSEIGIIAEFRGIPNRFPNLAYKEAITFKWNAKFQLDLPDMHCRNQAERAILRFKDHFLAILAGINSAFPPYLWDPLLPQAELTLNLLRQATLNPRVSAWEFSKGSLTSTRHRLVQLVVASSFMQSRPLGGLGISVQSLVSTILALLYLDFYCCFKLVMANTKSQVISDTVKFHHVYLSVPVPSAEDKIIHSLQVIAGAIQGAPPPKSVSQLEAITAFQEIFES
jgi:hypothetical protein